MRGSISVLLGDHFECFIEDKISEGKYKDASEIVRAGLRLLEEEESKIKTLKLAIQEGIASGIADDFKPEKHLAALKANKKKNG